MLVAGIDLEATGKDPQKASITEIGAVLWESDGWIKMGEYSTLVYAPEYPAQSQEVIRVTGITDEDLKTKGVLPQRALKQFLTFIQDAQYCLAHNVSYDKVLLECELEKYKIVGAPLASNWICTLVDVPYPEWYVCKKLSHLALDHGIMVDPQKLHRAIGDVTLMGELLNIGEYSIERILEYKRMPWVYIQAIILPPWKDNGEGVAKAKAIGYGWERARQTDGPTFAKQWVKRVKKNKLEEEMRAAPFKTKILLEEKCYKK